MKLIDQRTVLCRQALNGLHYWPAKRMLDKDLTPPGHTRWIDWLNTIADTPLMKWSKR